MIMRESRLSVYLFAYDTLVASGDLGAPLGVHPNVGYSILFIAALQKIHKKDFKILDRRNQVQTRSTRFNFDSINVSPNSGRSNARNIHSTFVEAGITLTNIKHPSSEATYGPCSIPAFR
jgi:hypothetical protein